MNQKLEEQIVKIAPYMFKLRHNFKTKVNYPLIFGFEYDDGWFELTKKLVEKIKEIDKDKEIRVAQAKEKFGGLRFYLARGSKDTDRNNAIYKIIEKAENKSVKTCEVCGKPGRERGSHWIKTLCDECNDKKNY